MSLGENRAGDDGLKKGAEKENLAGDFIRALFSVKTLLVLAVLAGLVAARMHVTEKSNVPVPRVVKSVNITRPEVRNMEASLSLPGTLEAVEEASLNAHITGYLKKLYVDEGDNVKAGQILAEIDAPDVMDEYSKAKADLSLKNVTRERYLKLLNGNVISQQEFDGIDSAYSEAKAKFNTAKAWVGYTKITAPFTGSIARRFKYQGDYISPTGRGENASIFLMVNEKLLRAAVYVPQSDVSRVRVGNLVDITVDAFPNQIFKGEISRLDALLDQSTKTQRVLVDVKNADNRLRAGMFVSVLLHFNVKENALALPSDLVETEGAKKFVYLFADGRAKKTFVTVGIAQGDRVEIISGLSAGDDVIQRGMLAIGDGEQVLALKKDAGAERNNNGKSGA